MSTASYCVTEQSLQWEESVTRVYRSGHAEYHVAKNDIRTDVEGLKEEIKKWKYKYSCLKKTVTSIQTELSESVKESTYSKTGLDTQTSVQRESTTHNQIRTVKTKTKKKQKQNKNNKKKNNNNTKTGV